MTMRKHPVTALSYVLSRGLRGMAHAPLVQLLAVATTAVCMVLLGVVLLVWINARTATHQWGLDVPLTVYFDEQAKDGDVEGLAEQLARMETVTEVERVSSDLAMERITEGLGGSSSDVFLEGIDPSLLPESLDVYLAPSAPSTLAAELAGRLQSLEFVEEVVVAGAWVERAHETVETLGRLAIGVGILVGLACVAIIWSMIRLGVFARRDEIEILHLVGATRRFVRGPFVLEGALQGALGASLALGLLAVTFDAVAPHLREGLGLVLGAGSLRFFVPEEIALCIAFGTLVGLLGSALAVGRHTRGRA